MQGLHYTLQGNEWCKTRKLILHCLWPNDGRHSFIDDWGSWLGQTFFLSFFFPSLDARHLIYYFCSQMAANLDEIATGVVIHSAPASGYRKVLRFSISTLDSWTCNIQQLSSSWLFFTWHFSLRLFCIILAYYFNNILSHSLK